MWHPKTKKELISWIQVHYPGWKLNSRSKKELYAIHYHILSKTSKGEFVGKYKSVSL
jgi:hypothetical protein